MLVTRRFETDITYLPSRYLVKAWLYIAANAAMPHFNHCQISDNRANEIAAFHLPYFGGATLRGDKLFLHHGGGTMPGEFIADAPINKKVSRALFEHHFG